MLFLSLSSCVLQILISFLRCQFICFLPISLHTQAVLAILRPHSVLRNPSAFFQVLLLSTLFCHAGVFCFGVWLSLMLLVFVLCVRLLYVAILCHCPALRLLLDSCACLHACYPSRVIALSVNVMFICYLVCFIDICSTCICVLVVI